MATEFDFPVIATVEELDEVIERSRSAENPVILFNHDPWCPISARAYAEMKKAELPGEIGLIDVSRLKLVTQALAERTGIRHESPQVIVMKDGVPTWNASHFGITNDAVRQIVSNPT